MHASARLAFGALAGIALAGSAHAAFLITYEAPGVENTTATYQGGVETFDSQTGPNFTSTFGGSDVTGVYTGVSVVPFDQYGGAGGSGNYALALETSTPVSYSLSLSTTNPNGINYFGFWLSALDSGNQVSLYNGATEVASLNAASVLNAIDARPGAAAYFGNPGGPYQGYDGAQPYVFVNFFDQGGTFNRVVFTENAADSGFESDNHTVGFYTGISGMAVPEPAAWALMLAGFCLIGAAARRRPLAVVQAS